MIEITERKKTSRKQLERRLEKYAAPIIVLDENTAAVQSHLENLGNLPPSLIERMAGDGLNAIVGNGDVVTLISRAWNFRLCLSHTRMRLIPRPDGKRWRDTIGAYCPSSKTVIAGSKGNVPRGSSVILHEHGHALWHLSRKTTAHYRYAIRGMHGQLFPGLTRHEQQGGPRHGPGVHEFFANSFHSLHALPRERFVEKYSKEWHDLLTEMIKEYVLG